MNEIKEMKKKLADMGELNSHTKSGLNKMKKEDLVNMILDFEGRIGEAYDQVMNMANELIKEVETIGVLPSIEETAESPFPVTVLDDPEVKTEIVVGPDGDPIGKAIFKANEDCFGWFTPEKIGVPEKIKKGTEVELLACKLITHKIYGNISPFKWIYNLRGGKKTHGIVYIENKNLSYVSGNLGDRF